MRLKRICYWVMCLSSLCFSWAAAQEFVIDGAILNDTPAGARAAAMGQAYTALVNDATALLWNAAGLAASNRASASISTSLSFGKMEINPPVNFQPNKSYTATQGGDFSLNYVGFTIPITTQEMNFVSAIAIRNMVDLNDNFTWTTTDASTGTQLEKTIDRSGGVFSLSGGIGINVLPNLSMGTSLNFIAGKQEMREAEKVTSDQKETVSKDSWKNNFSGFSVDVGISWRASQVLTFANRFTFPYTIHYANLEYTDPSDKKREYEEKKSLSKPLSSAFGVAVKPHADWTIAVDYVLRPWKKASVKSESQENDLPFANAHSFRLGCEYLVRSGTFDMPLRLGFFTNPEQVFEFNTSEPSLRGSQAKSLFITGGLGIKAKNTIFDVALDYHLLGYQTDFLSLGANPFELKKAKFRILLSLQFMLS